MSPTRCGKPWTGTCFPTPRVAGMDRLGSGRGGTSLAFPAGPARIPNPHRCGRPTAWWAPWTGIWAPTGIGNCPRRSAPAPPRPASPRAARSWPSPPGCPRLCGRQVARGPITMARWRWCSPACPAGMWCCRCGCLKARASGRTWRISWPSLRCGTRSTWCGSATVERLVVGATYAHLLVHQGGYQSRGDQGSPRRDTGGAARRGGCQRVQPGAGLLPRRASRAVGYRADHL